MRTFFKNRRDLFAFVTLGIVVGIILIIIVRGFVRTKEPIKIGLPATMTGTRSSFGMYVRNGILLATEQVNKDGGINGYPIKLIVKDDKGDPQKALQVDRELIDEGVIVMFGHYMSALAVKAVPLMNEKNILMVAATASTDELTGIDDNYIRMIVPADKQSLAIARLAYNRLDIRKVAVVYDISNLNYVDAICRHFKKEFERLGGEIFLPIAFDSREKYSMPEIVKDIMKLDADGLFIITNAYHGALICQHLNKKNSKIKIMASGWCFPDPDFIKHGGASVEGVISVSVFNRESSRKSFMKFKNEYENRFNEQIGMGCQLGYEAAQVLFSALSKTDDPGKLKETIIKQRLFKGLDSEIIIDEYGDPLRTMYISEIQNGKIKTVGKIEPSELLE